MTDRTAEEKVLPNQRSRRKSRNNRIYNYCKKPEQIKADCCAVKAKNDKAQRAEVNYVGSSAEVLSSDPNILSIEKPVESKVLLTTEESSTWLLDSGASYHVTPHRCQFRQYSARQSDSVRVENSQHCAIIGISTVEVNLPGGSTLILDNV